MGISNVMVVVTRWYGGTQLGSDRFKHISTCAQRALEEGQFFSKKNSGTTKTKSSKGSRKGKKK